MDAEHVSNRGDNVTCFRKSLSADMGNRKMYLGLELSGMGLFIVVR